METLGLASAREREDNFFQRLFWPTIHNQYDVELASRRGFWLTVTVAIVSFVFLIIQGSWLVALLTLSLFLLGAAGIRQKSMPASATVLALYASGVVANWVIALMAGVPVGNPLVSLVFIMLLCANLRAVVLSSRWIEAGTDTDLPDVDTLGVKGALLNRYPQSVWRVGRFIFYALAVLYIGLTLLGIYGMKLRTNASRTSPDTPSAVLPASTQQ